jgi:hypothetical protein
MKYIRQFAHALMPLKANGLNCKFKLRNRCVHYLLLASFVMMLETKKWQLRLSYE